MNSNIFGSDPWENEWNTDDANKNFSSLPALNATNSFLSSSQLLSQSGVSSTTEGSIDADDVPESYKILFSKIGTKLNVVNDLDIIFDRAIELHFFKAYQKSKILNTIYDHDLLPASVEQNFYQVLGLIALEISVPDSGDYVTLQFRRKNLPSLPSDLVDSILEHNEKKFVDPLTSQLSHTSMDKDDNWSNGQLHDSTQHSPLIDKSGITESDIRPRNEEDKIPVDNREIEKYVTDLREKFSPGIDSNAFVTIKEVPEKEGLLFKHINYMITHDIKLGMNLSSGTKKVIRRYSDFVWLLEFLLRKYPFRVIPGLPPKKFSGSSPDSQFLQRRRRGLQRFLNQLVKHPVLKSEPVVITFLSVPTDIVTWKKQAKIDYSLEFKGQKISTHFINSIWPCIGEEFLKNWARTDATISKIIDTWNKVILLVERYEKRQQQTAYDNNKFVEMLHGFKNLNTKLYPVDEASILGSTNKDDVETVNESLSHLSEYFNASSQALIDDSFVVNTSTLEKFKNYLDYLYSLQELFERAKRLSSNNIPQLQNSIKENEAKYNKLSNEDPDAKGTDLAKLRQSIINDKQEIFQQLNKDWLIKNCCFEEYIIFQETQYLLSEMWIEWVKGRNKFIKKIGTLTENLSHDISNEMPLPR